MRRAKMILAVAFVLLLGAATIATAQMMNGNHQHATMMNGSQHQTMMKNDSTQSGMTGEKMSSDFGSMMTNMSKQNSMMNGEFTQLETHFQKMMQMNDITALKKEMQSHYQMMQEMHQKMMNQQDMWKNMMTMMSTDQMQKMTGMTMPESTTSRQHAQHH